VKIKWDTPTLEAWIAQFKKAAILFHNGQYLAARGLEQAGSDACTALIRKLDLENIQGREVLIPLLADKNPYVQVSAARYLINIYPDLTIPLLKNLRENDVTGADFTAQNILWLYEDGWFGREAANEAALD
jgi:hypothetical protein